MPSFTKAQILNFLDNKIANSASGSGPNDASTRFVNLKLQKILVENDIITAAMINAAFTEWDA